MKIFFIILTVLSFGCATTENVPVGMTQEQVSTEQEAIKAMIDQLAITWNEEDFKKYYSLWDNNSELITREGEIYRLSKAYAEQVINNFQHQKSRVGNIKYEIKWVKLASSTAATGFAEYTCTTCYKGGIGKVSVKFKFVKNNGQWLVKLRDMSQ